MMSIKGQRAAASFEPNAFGTNMSATAGRPRPGVNLQARPAPCPCEPSFAPQTVAFVQDCDRDSLTILAHHIIVRSAVDSCCSLDTDRIGRRRLSTARDERSWIHHRCRLDPGGRFQGDRSLEKAMVADADAVRLYHARGLLVCIPARLFTCAMGSAQVSLQQLSAA
eukprot:4852070-Pleurochrysis_carterae.AAC.3